jgi:adenylylsulfate kinase
MEMKMAGKIIWFTGLSGSGKTTLANNLAGWLKSRDISTVIIDGDEIRKVWKAGFTKDEREEHLIRCGKLALMLARQGITVIGALINPIRHIRMVMNNNMIDHNIPYALVYTKCPYEICEQRDVKGLYAKARRGEIENFTGKSQIYEEPHSASLVLKTDILNIPECLDLLIKLYGQI